MVPVDRTTTEGLSAEVAALYAAAEVQLLQLIARHMRAGHESPRWAEDKLAELQMFRHRVEVIMATTTRHATDASGRALHTAYLRGTASGQGDLDAAGIEAARPPTHAERAVEALARAQADTLRGVELRVVRQVADVYRDVITRVSAGVVIGATTRLQAAQQALDDLAHKGVTGFTDTAGRNWSLPSYTEMATRTTTAQASVQAHLDRLEDGGIPLVLVSDSTRECERCRPWEGKILSRGPVAALLPNAQTGVMERVEVDGTVADALAGGLMHPNCTHNLSGYVPGATVAHQATANPKGYAEKVRQRELERHVREWKRREAVALTPEAQRRARVKVREWQGQLKAHTEATGLPRKRNRESLTAAR